MISTVMLYSVLMNCSRFLDIFSEATIHFEKALYTTEMMKLTLRDEDPLFALDTCDVNTAKFALRGSVCLLFTESSFVLLGDLAYRVKMTHSKTFCSVKSCDASLKTTECFVWSHPSKFCTTFISLIIWYNCLLLKCY